MTPFLFPKRIQGGLSCTDAEYLDALENAAQELDLDNVLKHDNPAKGATPSAFLCCPKLRVAFGTVKCQTVA